VSLAHVEFEAESFPEQNAHGGGIYGDQPAGLLCPLKQSRRQLAADTAPPEPRADIEPPHAQCARHNRLDRQTSDSDKHAIQARGEQRFAFTVEARRAPAASCSTCRNPSASTSAHSVSKPAGKSPVTGSSSSGSIR
jgi:hypothetical protein